MGHVALMNASCRTYPWVMSHIWMRHVAYINASCRTYECDIPHVWMSAVAHMNAHVKECCRTYEWVMLHIWMGHVAHTNKDKWIRHVAHILELSSKELCPTCQWGMPHMWMRHVAHMYESCHTHMNESCRAHEWAMSHIRTSHVAGAAVQDRGGAARSAEVDKLLHSRHERCVFPLLSCPSDLPVTSTLSHTHVHTHTYTHTHTHAHTCRHTHTHTRTHAHNMPHVHHEEFVFPIFNMCDMISVPASMSVRLDRTHLYVCDGFLICVSWLNHISNMSDLQSWHDSFDFWLACSSDLLVTHLELIHLCDMTASRWRVNTQTHAHVDTLTHTLSFSPSVSLSHTDEKFRWSCCWA